ncbi:MAG: RdgB/HAM1 family non-canonical purine NTP pyrophosphatase [Kiritimatiellae bacterium]|nr:RdgB/HAM1 family non-canonical purine NTP pyrophosphatase [Kiritimatiellia bacterium]
MLKILVATRNQHKLAEIREIFQIANLQLVAADEIAGLPEDVVEDAATFEGNALKKARELCQASGLLTMADDSGLEVDALGLAPGVCSARYAGEGCDHAANNAKLLRELEGVANRRARFRCVIALCAPDGREWTLDGSCEGTILHQPRGGGGFGYDPLFAPEGYPQSFAELDAAVKNSMSHRGIALRKAALQWAAIFKDYGV